MNTYIGCDVGLTGALGVITPDGVYVYDTPILQVGHKRDYAVSAMVELLAPHAGAATVALEAVHSMPKQGVASSFGFGRGLGLWEGIIAAFGMPYTKVTPQRWQGLLLDGMPKEKDSARLRASQLFPKLDLHRKKDHGRADAILMAEWLRRTAP